MIKAVKKIILALDMDPGNRNIIHYTVELANLSEAYLYIGHIVAEDQPIYGQDIYHITSPDDKKVHETALKRLASIYPNAYPWSIRLNCKISYASYNASQIPNGITKLSQEIGADLVILKKDTHPGLFKKYFGEITKKVISESKCIVLLVPDHLDSPACNTLAYASSFENNDKNILSDLHRFAKLFGAKVSRFHIRTDMKKNSAKELQEEGTENAIDKDYLLTGKNVIEGIQYFLKTQHPDILAFSLLEKEVHETFNSLAFRTFIAEIKIPVLFIPEN